MEDDVDISTLTIEQCIALIPYDIKPGIVNPKIGDDVEFEINANFMRELRRKLFAGTDDEDAYEHVRTVLKIVDLFHFPCVTHDAIMLRIFPITFKGRALRWKNRLPAGTITTRGLLKKELIWRYCHPFITAKKLEEIRNFKQERDETLYHAWERYNDLIYQCLLHDLNSQKKVHIFYTGLDISTRKILDSNGFIPLMTPTQALKSIQVMAEHSHNWYDETTTRERINDDEAIKHGKYMQSLEDTIIKFCEDTIKKQTVDDERMRKILENTESNITALKTGTKNLQEKAYQLTYKVLTNTCEKVKAITTMGKENMKEPVPRNLPPTPFLGHLKEQMGSPYRTRETVCKIENLKKIHNEKAQEDE
ncbi:ribonuclease H-like domain-containing protein [Tanacetum coccineum]